MCMYRAAGRTSGVGVVENTKLLLLLLLLLWLKAAVFVLLGYDGAFLNCCLAVDVCEVLGGVQYGVRAVR